MADTPDQARLVDLPYGTRQRIVVVPDEILDSRESPGEPAGSTAARRLWGASRGDARHPTLKALKEADEEGLRLLPVRQSHVEQLTMPVGHPISNIVYVGSPAVAARYYPAADFHVRVFEERFGEAMRLLMGLGAERLTVRSEHGWKRDISASLDAPIQRLKNRGRVRSGGRRDRSLVFEAELAPSAMPEVPDGLVWFDYEPTWQAVAEGRSRYGLQEFQLQVTSREDFGVNADFAAKIRQRKILGLGGAFTEHVDTAWVLEGTFGEQPKRGWLRGA